MKTAKKLLVVLCLLLAVCGCSARNTIVKDFIGHDVSEVYEWCADIGKKYSCEVSYVDGNGVEKDKVVSQSVVGGNRLESDIHFEISNGASPEIPVLHITPETERSDVEAWVASSGLQNVTFIDESNDSIPNNHIIRIDPNTGIYRDTPLTVYVSSGRVEPVPTDIEVKYGTYIGLTVEEFEKKAAELGLRPNHQTSRDRYDANVKFGNIAWHGSGTYVKDEVFNYGICINEIYISSGQYVGISEDEFIAAAKKLNLTPKHISDRDAYSTSIDKGYIVTHGYGTYEENEQFKYGISLGAAKVMSGYEGASEDVFLEYLSSLTLNGDRSTRKSDDVPEGRVISYNTGRYSTGDYVSYVVSAGKDLSVNVPDFSGHSEREFLNFLDDNGLKAGVRSVDSSLTPVGSLISNDTGIKFKGDSVNYIVSSGPYVPMARIDSIDYFRDNLVDVDGGYSSTVENIAIYLGAKGFSNYTFVRAFNPDYPAGSILDFTIDGDELYGSRDAYINSEIIITLSDDRLY